MSFLRTMVIQKCMAALNNASMNETGLKYNSYGYIIKKR